MQHAATASSVIGIDVCRVLITGLEIRYRASDGEPGAALVQCSAAVPKASAISQSSGYFPDPRRLVFGLPFFFSQS